MINVTYYINVVERGKLIAFCKVFQHHSSLFPIISYYLTTFNNIPQHSTSFNIIPYYPTTFSPILPYSPSSPIFRQHLTTSYIILPLSPTFSKISHTSTTFSIIRQIDNIFLQYFSTTFFSTTFDNILQNLYSTENFVFCCQIKKLSFTVLST